MRPFWLAALLAMCVGNGCVWQRWFAPPPTQEERLAELVRTIDYHGPASLHSDWTPSVYKLIELGEPAIRPMLDLMLADDEGTRARAQNVITWVYMEKFGFQHGWKQPEDKERYEAFWKSLPKLDPKAPREEREHAVKVWKAWLADNSPR